MQWLSGHGQVLIVLLNAGMLLVWIFFAQLLLTSYRRGRRATIIIDHGVGCRLRSLCLIGNMSNEAVFVQLVSAALHDKEDRITGAITDVKVRERGEDSSAADGVSTIQAQTVHGPIQAGAYLDIGTFGEIVDSVLHKREASGEGRQEEGDRYSLELTVIATFGPENQPVGARRSFQFSRSESGGHRIWPATVATKRMTSLRERRQMRRWLQQYV